MDHESKIKGLTTRRSRSSITATHWERHVDVYSVFDHEFRAIKSAASQSGLYLTFFGVFVGITITLLTVLLTVELTNPWVFASFAVGFGVSFPITVLLGLKARQEYRSTTAQFDYIEERSIQGESRPVTVARR